MVILIDLLALVSLAGSLDARWAWRVDILPQETGTAAINIYPNGTSEDATKSSSEEITPCAALQFLLDNAAQGDGLVKLLLPVQPGYIVQSDFLERRMLDCPGVTKVQGFITPGQQVKGLSAAECCQSMSLSSLLPYCYGAAVVQSNGSSSVTARSTAVNDELIKRISFSWLSPKAIPRKRLALVGISSFLKIQGYLIAAASLNIAIVAFDEASHWLSSETYRHLREKFVPLDMTVDANMAQRIATTLTEYQKSNPEDRRLDGIITGDEHFRTIIAHAAAMLGFNTSPPEAVGLAQNKFATRQLDNNVFCRLVRSPDELERMLSEDGPQIHYPLIVKPSRGWSSEGVWKVANEQELREKVPLLWRDAFTSWHGHDVVIETYVDGPEVDVNMVLVDDKIVFFEVNDDFPSAGDYPNGKSGARVANFVETSNILPSCLPPSELGILQQRLHELALKAGFRNAVLHMEAKLRNSSCHYARGSGGDAVVDLQVKSPTEKTTMQPKDIFLLEINPRAPGWQEVEATARAYGVSYYSISLVNALADKDRTVSLSKPFVGGPQYNMQILFVSAQKGGVYKFGDICSTVLRPDGQGSSPGQQQQQQLAANVVQCANLMEDGEEVLDPSMGQVYGNFIAFFLVVSRTSRKEAIHIGYEIERRVREHTGGF